MVLVYMYIMAITMYSNIYTDLAYHQRQLSKQNINTDKLYSTFMCYCIAFATCRTQACMHICSLIILFVCNGQCITFLFKTSYTKGQISSFNTFFRSLVAQNKKKLIKKSPNDFKTQAFFLSKKTQ